MLKNQAVNNNNAAEASRSSGLTISPELYAKSLYTVSMPGMEIPIIDWGSVNRANLINIQHLTDGQIFGKTLTQMILDFNPPPNGAMKHDQETLNRVEKEVTALLRRNDRYQFICPGSFMSGISLYERLFKFKDENGVKLTGDRLEIAQSALVELKRVFTHFEIFYACILLAYKNNEDDPEHYLVSNNTMSQLVRMGLPTLNQSELEVLKALDYVIGSRRGKFAPIINEEGNALLNLTLAFEKPLALNMKEIKLA